MSSRKKLSEFFYINKEGNILKYRKYCIINDCKKLSSYNYSGQKENLYCNEHKLNKMVNVRKGYSFFEKHNISYLTFCKECERFDCLLLMKQLIKVIIFLKNILIKLIIIFQLK